MTGRMILVVCLLALVNRAFAGEYNPTLNIGDAAPAWTDLPGTDDARHALADLKDKPLVLVVFTCNSCDVAADYEDRIIALARKYADRVATVAINVNKIEADLLPEMKKRAEAKQYPFAYLFDETQQVGRDYGATFTPEFFLLDQERRIRYMGGMDDSSSVANVEQRYLEPAIESLLAGNNIETAETPAIGCLIRYDRKRNRD